jgi:hypothetical protein
MSCQLPQQRTEDICALALFDKGTIAVEKRNNCGVGDIGRSGPNGPLKVLDNGGTCSQGRILLVQRYTLK